MRSPHLSVRAIRAVGTLCLLGLLGVVAVAHAASSATGSLRQQVTVSWQANDWKGHQQASFAIPGIGVGEVTCSPNTTWIRVTPSDRTAENAMWSVKFETKNGMAQTAVKDARVYEFSTPTSTVPHGTGPSTNEGFNQFTPVESSQHGWMTGLISKRAARNAPGGPGVAPTGFTLSWNWSGFGSSRAACQVQATFTTQIRGRSRSTYTNANYRAPKTGAVSSFNLNWHGAADAPAAAARNPSLLVPGIGMVSAVCDAGTDGPAQLTVTPLAGVSPFADVLAYQGEGTDNVTENQYYADPASGQLGPIALPVNGMLRISLKPSWNAPAAQTASLVISSVHKTNDPDPAANYCEVSAQAVAAAG